jgi:hypothetical protein
MDMSAAANNPAPVPFASLVKKYVAKAVNPENTGAKNTHTFLQGVG